MRRSNVRNRPDNMTLGQPLIPLVGQRWANVNFSQRCVHRQKWRRGNHWLQRWVNGWQRLAQRWFTRGVLSGILQQYFIYDMLPYKRLHLPCWRNQRTAASLIQTHLVCSCRPQYIWILELVGRMPSAVYLVKCFHHLKKVSVNEMRFGHGRMEINPLCFHFRGVYRWFNSL